MTKQNWFAGAVAGMVFGLAFVPAHAQGVLWVSSSEGAVWKTMPVQTVSTPVALGSENVLTLDEATTFQTMDGFGGCFNEYGWIALQAANEKGRQTALAAMFSPTEANFTLARAPIGANDFAIGPYTLDETPGDFAMKHFTIEHDQVNLIPFMKAAMKYQPNLGVWGVPWGPPAWMSTNGRYAHGELKPDPETLTAYALYFEKYIQGYRAEGINLYAVMPQNEPNFNDNIYPQSLVRPATMNIFLRDYLGPRLKQDKVNVELWLGTIVKPAQDYIDETLRDPVTSKMITGVALQYVGQDSLFRTNLLYPDKKLMQSETECYHGQNSWSEGMTTFEKIIDDSRNGISSYFFWNLVLDDGGLSHWGWRQNSLITVNRADGRIVFNPEFYSMKHFSAFVQPGAKRITVESSAVAFKNPNGQDVIVFANKTNKTMPMDVVSGTLHVRIDVPAKSMNTVVLPSHS